MAEALISQLVAQSSEFAAAAGKALIEKRGRQFAMSAATTVELLGKAVICKQIHPAAVADGKDFNSILFLSGHKALVAKKFRPKTIGGREVLERCVVFMAKIKGSPADALSMLVDMRNGVAHMGEGADDIPDAALRAFDLFVREAARLIGISPSKVLAPYERLFSRLSDEAASKIHKIVELKLATARDRFQSRYGNVSPERRRSLRVAVRPQLMADIDVDADCECPAGGEMGRASCAKSKELGDGVFRVTLFPGYFVCGYCDLQLDDFEEVEAAHLSEFEGEDEPYDGPDPDDAYDLWRESQLEDEVS